MKLIQLSNGQWISPDTVTAVICVEGTEHRADSVVVRTGSQAFTCYPGNPESAAELRDKIATQVNSAMSMASFEHIANQTQQP